MNRLTRLIGLGSMATLLALPTSAALADDSDIFGANIQPNVVIMIDNSGSMGDSAPSNSFDVPPPNGTAAYYPVLNNCDPSGKPKVYQACASLKVFKSGSSNTYTSYANTVSAVTGTGSAAAQAALNSAGYWSGKINGSTVNLCAPACARIGSRSSCAASLVISSRTTVSFSPLTVVPTR